jgi:hypothetical protein
MYVHPLAICWMLVSPQELFIFLDVVHSLKQKADAECAGAQIGATAHPADQPADIQNAHGQ